MQSASSEPVSTQSPASLDEIIGPVAEGMKQVDQFIKTELHSDIALINTISHYIINNGGKRLRPVMLLLAAAACGNKTRHNIALAAIIEFIHTATLLHDDVVDESALRRGQNTANDVWGNQASVLVGDFLYSRAFQQMVRVDNMKVMDILADTTNMIAEGEVLQLMNSHNAAISNDDYYQTIHRKTAILFKAACQLGAVIADDSNMESALAQYGLNMGIAFQLIDDVLDYSGDAGTTGKNVGDDLSDGKMTLPLIRALQKTSQENQTYLKGIIESGANDEDIENIIKIINTTDAIDFTRQQATQYTTEAKSAITELPDSIYKQSMLDLTDFFVARVY